MMSSYTIQPVKVGNLILPSNVIQGPLAGYSCAPFRVITHRYGSPGFCATEMISATALTSRQDRPKRYLMRDHKEGLLCYQLAANNPDTLAQATTMVSEEGADIVDLNCGCPVQKIRRKGTGSKLLTEPETLYRLVKAMRENTDATVSIKIRGAGDAGDHDERAIVEAAELGGVDFITVHGRHWSERYDVSCRHEDIEKIVSIASVPVFANGDVDSFSSFHTIMQATKAAGVMVARASVGRPWLFKQIYAEARGEAYITPDFISIGKIFVEHIKGLVALESERLAILQSRKLAKYYARDLPGRTAFVEKAQQAITLSSLLQLIDDFFGVTAIC
jgi:tRNA-dihydrouridine synthase B